MPLEECAIEDSPVEASTNDGTDEAAVDQHGVSSSAFEPQGLQTNADPDARILQAEVKLFQRSHRMSTISMPSIAEEVDLVPRPASFRSRSDSSGTLSSSSSAHVDWEELTRAEEAAPRDEGSDESTAFLLARLEQENNALATDPKAAISRTSRDRTKSRPLSIQKLKKLVDEPTKPSLRYSVLPEPPAMTELEFWAALVSNYPHTAQRLPTLTSNKIRAGIPPPLRGVVWSSIAGARDQLLEDEYVRLCTETSPYEILIGKDIGRSFPNVDMFKDPAGEGQQMLAKVLRAFSIYDQKIGYCQGLGLMEHYDLRSCFLPDLSGLHLRIYQFQNLLKRHLPTLNAHLEGLQVEPLYVSQWFLSFFAVTCPLPMLLRIYDVILTEGASETLMRVALSLMRRNDKKIKACTEFEDVMHLLLSRELWDTYSCNADDLVNDFVGLTGLVTRESLEALEKSFKDTQFGDSPTKIGTTHSVQAAASGFLGRFWTGSSSATKATSPTSSLAVSAASRPSSSLRRTQSKQSMTSTLNSVETAESQGAKASTEATTMSRNPSGDCTNMKPGQPSANAAPLVSTLSHSDKDLHSQIEDLLIALSDMQREQSILTRELQREREEREEDRAVVCRFLSLARAPAEPQPVVNPEVGIVMRQADIPPVDTATPLGAAHALLLHLEDRFEASTIKRSSIVQTKYELRDDIKNWKDQYEIEATRSADLRRQLADREKETVRALEQFREVRSRLQESQKEKQKLEKTIEEMRSRSMSIEPCITIGNAERRPSATGGLRDFKLGRTGSAPALNAPVPAFSKRSSSLGLQAVLATEDQQPLADEALLLELVNAKTAEAVARQELEEVKGKLDTFKKIIGSTGPPPAIHGHRPSPSEPCAAGGVPNGTSTFSRASASHAGQQSLKVTTAASPSRGFFSGWGQRTVSSPAK
ncbi:MAG: hypothetical protein Q9196_003220 [Gyalolechia fulgens]